MNLTKSTATAATTAERAYFLYLERQRLGLPGSAHDDWVRAETSVPRCDLPLTAIKGIGPRVAAQLEACGVRDVSHLASWRLADFGEQLPRLTARAKSGRWIEQARELV